jgi:hypothetical protein
VLVISFGTRNELRGGGGNPRSKDKTLRFVSQWVIARQKVDPLQKY